MEEELLIALIDIISVGMTEIQTLDEDYGQLEALLSGEKEDNYPLLFPAVLVHAPMTDWNNLAGGNQKGQTTVNVRLMMDCYDDTHYGSTTTDKIKDRADMVKKLHDLLQNKSLPESTPLIRTQSKSVNMGGGIKVYELTYTCVITDMAPVATTPHKITGVKINTNMI